MARILQCIVCITVMMSSAQSQGGYFYHQTYQTGVVQPAFNPHDRLQRSNLQNDNQPISENLSRRNLEDTRHRIHTRQGSQNLRNGTYKILNRLQLNKRGALEDTLASDRVVFPGRTSQPEFVPEIPDDCKAQGYCETVPNYPTDYIEKLVANLGDAVKYFTKDQLGDDGVEIAQRLGGGASSDHEVQLCKYTEELLVPQSAQDTDSKWWTVINLKDKPLQVFRAEVCSKNSGCNNLATVQDGYTSTCKQKHVYRMMEVLDESGVQLQKTLKVPSCCACVLKVDNPFK